MRKVLEITPDVEKKFVAVLDAALKAQGITMLDNVQSIVTAVHEEPELEKLNLSKIES